MDYVEQNFPHFDYAGRDLVRKAYAIAAQALRDDTRGNGHPFMEHPEGVARIVADGMGLPAECVAAVFLHEATRMHPETDIKGAGFGADVLKMVDGLNKISTIKPNDTRLEAENYKRLIVQYSTDPRVTVIKIADRLEVMRNLALFPKSARENKILETLMLYIPLAHQLGLYNVKSEMEDIYFRWAEPEQYRTITNKLKAGERDRVKLMDEFIKPLEADLREAGIKYRLKVRTKTAYSIFRKMQKQKVPFEGVYDVFAIRFVIDCEDDLKTEQKLCWDVFSYVTKEYEQDTPRLRDWITKPKPNGYESLHITVKNRDGVFIEVQIRTKRMDDIDENGPAAHWSYKGVAHVAAIDNWLKTVRHNLEHRQDVSPEDLPEPPSGEIFVYTPTGDLRILPEGASLLDFAFNIHSNLGLRCTGGRVNGKAVSIKEKLKTGDVVEIMSGKNQKPSADWVNYVVTSKARSKIRQAMNEEEFKKASAGRELLERRLRNWKLELPDEFLSELMKKHRLDSELSFYAAIADGTLPVDSVKSYILDHDSMVAEGIEAAKAAAGARRQWNAPESTSDDILVINARNLKGLEYKMAKCCNPVFGDDVFGFVTRTSGITIHRISCPNAARLIESYPYRIQKVKWASNPVGGSFQAAIRLTTAQDGSVTGKVMEVVAGFKASVRSFNVSEDRRHGTQDITMKLSVPSNSELDKVLSQLRLVRGVVKVSRL